MSKQVASKKPRRVEVSKSKPLDVNDIIRKMDESHAKADKKLAELSKMCLEKDCRVKT